MRYVEKCRAGEKLRAVFDKWKLLPPSRSIYMPEYNIIDAQKRNSLSRAGFFSFSLFPIEI